MLLVALAVFFGACYILYLRTLQSKLVLFGEKFPAQMAPHAFLIAVSRSANLRIWDSSRPPHRDVHKSLDLVLKGLDLPGAPLQTQLPKPRETPKAPGTSVSCK